MVTDYFSEYERARIECNDALQAHKEFMDLLGFYWKRIEAGQDPDLGDMPPIVAYTQYERVESRMRSAHEQFSLVTNLLFDRVTRRLLDGI